MTLGLYPFSTQDGKAIPLDIVKPLALFPVTINDGAVNDFTLPEGFELVNIYATMNCILRIGATITAVVNETELSNSIFVPSDVPMDIVMVPGPCAVWGVAGAAGTLYITAIQQWGALVQANQASIG
jgi:hypothetical protein